MEKKIERERERKNMIEMISEKTEKIKTRWEPVAVTGYYFRGEFYLPEEVHKVNGKTEPIQWKRKSVIQSINPVAVAVAVAVKPAKKQIDSAKEIAAFMREKMPGSKFENVVIAKVFGTDFFALIGKGKRSKEFAFYRGETYRYNERKIINRPIRYITENEVPLCIRAIVEKRKAVYFPAKGEPDKVETEQAK